jgi:hypothetical protein
LSWVTIAPYWHASARALLTFVLLSLLTLLKIPKQSAKPRILPAESRTYVAA